MFMPSMNRSPDQINSQMNGQMNGQTINQLTNPMNSQTSLTTMQNPMINPQMINILPLYPTIDQKSISQPTLNPPINQSFQPINQPNGQQLFPSNLQWYMLPNNQPMDQQLTQINSQSINQPISQPMNQPIIPQPWAWNPNNQAVTQSFTPPVNQTMNQPINQQFGISPAVQMNGQSPTQTCDQSVTVESINQTIAQTEQLVNQGMLGRALVLIIQTVHRSVNQSLNQPNTQVVNQSIERAILIGRSVTNQFIQTVVQSTSQARNQLIEEVLQSVNHPTISQPNNQPLCHSFWTELREILQQAISICLSLNQSTKPSNEQPVNQSPQSSKQSSSPPVNQMVKPTTFVPITIVTPSNSFSSPSDPPTNKSSNVAKKLVPKIRSFISANMSISSTNVAAAWKANKGLQSSSEPSSEESSDESVHHVNDQGKNQPNNHTNNQTNTQVKQESVTPISQPINHSSDASTDGRRSSFQVFAPSAVSNNQSVNRVIAPTFSQVVTQPLGQSMGHLFPPPLPSQMASPRNQSISPTINQPFFGQPMNHITTQSISQQIHPTVTPYVPHDPSFSQSTSQSASQSNGQPVDPSVTPIGARTTQCRYCHRVWHLTLAKDRETLIARNRQLKSKRDHVPYCRANPEREKNLSKRRAKKEMAKRFKANQPADQSGSDQAGQANETSHNGDGGKTDQE